MARVKRAQIKKKRVNKLFKRSKGFFLARKNTLRQANEAVMKARMNSYTGRKQRKHMRHRHLIGRQTSSVAKDRDSGEFFDPTHILPRGPRTS